MAEVRRFETNVLPLMACPAIGALIPEAFYTQSVSKILILPGEVSSEVVLPPVLVAKAMRHVKIEVQCPLYGLHTLKLLATCARRLLNLHTLVVEITGSDATTEELETIEPIQFSAKEMCVTYKHSTAAAGQEWMLDPNEMRVLDKMTVVTKRSEVEESMVRYNTIRDQKEIVSGWAARQDRTPRCKGRITEKHMWV